MSAPQRPLLPTTSNLGVGSSLEALEQVALQMACDKTQPQSAVSAGAGGGAMGGALGGPVATISEDSPLSPAQMSAAHEARWMALDSRASQIETDARSFEMSNRISKRLKDVADMPGVSDQLKPEVALNPVRARHVHESSRRSLLMRGATSGVALGSRSSRNFLAPLDDTRASGRFDTPAGARSPPSSPSPRRSASAKGRLSRFLPSTSDD